MIGLDDESLQLSAPDGVSAPVVTAARNDRQDETRRPAVLREDTESAMAAAYRAKVEEILASDIFAAVGPDDKGATQPASRSHEGG